MREPDADPSVSEPRRGTWGDTTGAKFAAAWANSQRCARDGSCPAGTARTRGCLAAQPFSKQTRRTRACASIDDGGHGEPAREPYSAFPLLSVGDVDRIVHKHRDECEGDFMISTAALSKLLGGSREAEMRATRLQTEKGIGRFRNQRSRLPLCGVVVVSRPVALHGVGDGVGCKACKEDLRSVRSATKGALNCHELLRLCLLTLARALESVPQAHGGGPRQ